MCFPMERAVEKKWEFEGLQCIVTRTDIGDPNRWSKHRCGYVRVPAGHPWHGLDYNEIPVDAHGGLTFAQIEPCGHEDGIGYWIGFDCAHLGDANYPQGEEPPRPYLTDDPSDHYWELHEVQGETERLAKQVLEARAA